MRLTIFGLILLLTSQLLAFKSGTSYKSGRSFTVSEQDTLQRDLYFGGADLNVDGIVKGDVIAGAREVYVRGEIGDDLYAFCESVYLEGKVKDSFVGFGKEITIRGVVDGDVIAYAGTVRLNDGARINGNLYVGCGKLIINNALIKGTIKGGAGRAFLNNKVEQPIRLNVGSIRFGDRFKSDQVVAITLHKKPQQALENAPVNLKITIKPQTYFYERALFYWLLLSAVIIGILCMILCPKLYDNLAGFGRQKPWTNLGMGVILVIGMPVVTVIAIIVLPLAFILGAVYLILLYLSKIFAAYIIGEWLNRTLFPEKRINRYVLFSVTILVLILLFEIPVIGFLIRLLTIIFGSGTFLYYLLQKRNNGKPALV